MTTCQHCASSDVHWFTPAVSADQGSVVLCRLCGHLSVRTARQARRADERKQVLVAAAA